MAKTRHGKFRPAEMNALHTHARDYYAPFLRKALKRDNVSFHFDKKMTDIGALHVTHGGRREKHIIHAKTLLLSDYFLYGILEHECIHVHQSTHMPNWAKGRRLRDAIMFDLAIEAETFAGQYFKFYRDTQAGHFDDAMLGRIIANAPDLVRGMAHALGEPGAGRMRATPAKLTQYAGAIGAQDDTQRAQTEKDLFGFLACAALKRGRVPYIQRAITAAKVALDAGDAAEFSSNAVDMTLYAKSMRAIFQRPGSPYATMFDKKLVDNIWDIAHGSMAKFDRQISAIQRRIDARV